MTLRASRNICQCLSFLLLLNDSTLPKRCWIWMLCMQTPEGCPQECADSCINKFIDIVLLLSYIKWGAVTLNNLLMVFCYQRSFCVDIKWPYYSFTSEIHFILTSKYSQECYIWSQGKMWWRTSEEKLLLLHNWLL